MVSSTQQALAKGNQFGNVTRPARALLGWMAQNEAELALVQRQMNAVTAEHTQRATRARASVAARAPGIDQDNLLTDMREELSAHVQQLQADSSFAQFLAEQWSFKIADLSKVCALQPIVFWDHATERAQAAVAEQMLTLAAITLPIPQNAELPLQFDQIHNTWIIASRNPNLRLVGNFAAPVGGHFGCGFLVAVQPSFVQVASYRNRYVLRDGYHRALGLLAKGVKKVPVLFREFGQFEPLGIGPGMLPDVAWLGDRPPLLSDYLSDDVSAEVQLPASQKMLVVQGLEMNPLG